MTCNSEMDEDDLSDKVIKLMTCNSEMDEDNLSDKDYDL
jgi:hypothetical protein